VEAAKDVGEKMLKQNAVKKQNHKMKMPQIFYTSKT